MGLICEIAMILNFNNIFYVICMDKEKNFDTAYEILMLEDVKELYKTLPNIFDYPGIKNKLNEFTDDDLLILTMNISNSHLTITNIKKVTVDFIESHLKDESADRVNKLRAELNEIKQMPLTKSAYDVHERYHQIQEKDIEIKSYTKGYKEGQIDAVKHLFENKIVIIRAVKTLSGDMQNVAKKAGYKPDDMLFITMEKIKGEVVDWRKKKERIDNE